ncbi:hypothetical protein FGE12_13695 [Aggregicoccus sp. 17bor-14]|uniref:hypothetical protein n=1 Tax=Myxococcaceae TaxID=31 RepID=UPI00129C3907|nr:MULTISPECIES: hypothetical protein [Myxococcaceae]MBF5043446.1 hypothetical protein [Simulacricoccus sp. 17bor-14]MRI89204.1 hypothetical protein [Aggregicoccus sp. 17bor-14]
MPNHVHRGARALLLLFLSAAAAACSGSPAPGGPEAESPGPADSGTPDTPGTPPGPPVPPEPLPGASACPGLEVQRDVSVDSGYRSDRYTWRDAACRPRSAALVRNDVRDPAGKWGGYLRRHTYEVGGAVRSSGGNSTDHPGFGYLVNHFGNSAALSYGFAGTGRAVLAGRHHAIHEFRWRLTLDGHPVDATVHWFFATGRDHPVWAVTYDCTPAGRNAVNADTRSPYGDLRFDGDVGADVAGVGWGDHYRFRSLASPVTQASGWDYTQANTVPYVRMWTAQPDAEMGAVQTQTWQQHDAGGFWFYPSWGKRSDAGPMPEDYNWPYQLNQYELPFTTRSHRLAWGTNYGAVGQAAYNAMGEETPRLVGYPFQSYAVHVVLGTHAQDPVLAQVAQVEAVQRTTLSATRGSVLTQGPAGVGRTDTAAYQPAGYNPVYGTWEVQAAQGAATVRFGVGSGAALQHPVLVLHGWTSAQPPTRVTLDGAALQPDVDYFATVDPAAGALWLTLGRTLQGSATLAVE